MLKFVSTTSSDMAATLEAKGLHCVVSKMFVNGKEETVYSYPETPELKAALADGKFNAAEYWTAPILKF